jgi:hypothetical protein
MEPDPILEEVWDAKDALARKCGYDVERMFDELNRLTSEHEKAGGVVIHSAEELRQYAAAEEKRRALESFVLNDKPPGEG